MFHIPNTTEINITETVKILTNDGRIFSHDATHTHTNNPINLALVSTIRKCAYGLLPSETKLRIGDTRPLVHAIEFNIMTESGLMLVDHWEFNSKSDRDSTMNNLINLV